LLRNDFHCNIYFQRMLKEFILMKTTSIINKALDVLQTTFTEVPLVRSAELHCDGQPEREDFTVDLKLVNTTAVTILVELKNSGQPRYARNAVNKLLRFQSERPDTYPVFMAPYISQVAGEICKEAGIGYIDFAGNCYLSFNSIFIRQEGNKNPYISSRKLRSLYQPVASRVLRVLLCDAGRFWKTQALSDEANVSLGQIANVKLALKDREWIKETSDGFRLSKPQELISEWSGSYEFYKNNVQSFYTLDNTAEAEKKIAEICRIKGIRCALTSFSGAARFAPNVRYNRIDVYVAGNIETITKTIGLKKVDSGSNIRLITPYDEGVFYNTKEINGIQVASPIQVYLDVLAQKGRGEEAAESILNEVIRKSW